MTEQSIGKLECAHLLYGPGNRRRCNDLRPFSGRDQDPLYSGRVGALKSMVERKELGIKTEKGFYTYPDPEFNRPDFIKG